MRETHKERKLRDQRRTGELENLETTEAAREAFKREPYEIVDVLGYIKGKYGGGNLGQGETR
ncbi:hypothetical protein KFE17_12045 [Faecalicatena sp. Marseille-Q4148]|nr:hypothetical protein KFE17_12045 [Faecalicatena sp. Marseille-Q4148]